MDNIKQEEFINSDGSVILIGIPGGGKSTSIVKYINEKLNLNVIENNNTLTFTFNKNAQLDLSNKIEESNAGQKFKHLIHFIYSLMKQMV